MSDLPRAAQQVLNARAVDAWEAMNQAVEDEDRDGFEVALNELREVFFDEGAVQREHSA